MKSMTRSVLALAFLVLISAVASAQTNISGTWEVTMDTPQGANTVDVTFKQTGEALSGELVSPLGTAPFTGGKLVKDDLTLTVPLDIQGTAIELSFTAKVTGDTMTGNVKFGDLGEAPLKAKRKTGAAAPAATTTTAASATSSSSSASTTTTAGANNITGNWNVSLNFQGQEIPITATFTQTGNAVTGMMNSPQGDIAVKGTMTGNALSLEFQANDMSITMVGSLGANGLSGKMTIAGVGDADWTGQRAK